MFVSHLINMRLVTFDKAPFWTQVQDPFDKLEWINGPAFHPALHSCKA